MNVYYKLYIFLKKGKKKKKTSQCAFLQIWISAFPLSMISVFHFVSLASGSENPSVVLKTLKGLRYGCAQVTVARVTIKQIQSRILKDHLIWWI